MADVRQSEIALNRSFDIYKIGTATVSKPANSTNGQTIVEYESDVPLVFVAYWSDDSSSSYNALPSVVFDVSTGSVIYTTNAYTYYSGTPGVYNLLLDVNVKTGTTAYTDATDWYFKYFLLRETPR